MSDSPELDRRRFCELAALGLLALPRSVTAMTDAAHVVSEIRPFCHNFSDMEVADMRRRVKATRFPEKETVNDTSRGVQLATMQKLVSYWGTTYDWKKAEAKLNSYPQFMTTIDGLDIHFIHVRSKHENALPMIVTHGWPGSVVEQLKIIEPLTNPMAHGGTAADAFHLVIPSLPGYGFSGKPTQPGWGPVKIAETWITLMDRLGYQKYVAQGGDWGSIITEQMALKKPAGLVAIHINMPQTLPPEVQNALNSGSGEPAGLSPEEKAAWKQLDYFWKKGLGYALEMANRPQTLYGLADSPAGLAAWMIDHDIASMQMISRSIAGQHEGLSMDDVLDNISFYWLTNTGVSSAYLYSENPLQFFLRKGVQIPTAVSVYPDEIYAAPKSWIDQSYPKLIHYNRLPKGGHFAAWEQPDFFVAEMRESFKTLR